MSFSNSYIHLQYRADNETFATYTDTSSQHKTPIAMRTVEIPLMVLAAFTVCLRVYSRLAVKRKLAVDDILIVLALVCPFHSSHLYPRDR